MPAASMVGKAVGERAGEETGEYPRWSLGYPSTGSPVGRAGGGRRYGAAQPVFNPLDLSLLFHAAILEPGLYLKKEISAIC